MNDKPTELSDKIARGALDPGIYFDRDRRSPRGFLLRVTAAGARAWCLNYRLRDSGRERRITIGDTASWPIAEARKRAHELRREIDSGGDPLADREDRRAAPTVAELAERYKAEILPRLAPRTQHEHAAMLRTWILPALGRQKVTEVERSDVEKLHRHVTAGSGDKANPGGPRRANMVKSLVSVLFNKAIVWDLRAPHTNPCELVAGNPEHGRERYLTGEEITRLMAVLEQRRRQQRWHDSVDVITLALLTGARRGEILAMEWADLDLDSALWVKPASGTKQRQPHHVPLSAAAVELLRQRRSSDTRSLRLVFRRGNSASGASRMDRDWSLIRAAAGLDDVRFHDLRHSFASLLVSAGESWPVIGRMLGHAKTQSTMRYAHLADQPLRDAAEIVAGKIVRGG
jgi:integrase